MTARGTRPVAELPWFNLLEVLEAGDPFGALDDLRAEAPMWRSDFGVHVLTYQGCLDLLRDRRFTQDAVRMLDAAGIVDEAVRRQWTTSMLGSPPSDHDRMRRLMSPSFTPRAISSLKARVAEVATAGVDAAAERGGAPGPPRDVRCPRGAHPAVGVDRPDRGAGHRRHPGVVTVRSLPLEVELA